MIAELAVEIEVRREGRIDQDTVSGRNDALASLLLDAAHALQLNEEEEVLTVIEANVMLFAPDNADIGGDLDDLRARNVGQHHPAVDDLALLPAERIETAADGLQLIAPCVQWILTPDLRSPTAKLLELHVRPSLIGLPSRGTRLITC